MASKNEKHAAELGMSLRQYKKSAEYKKKKANDKIKEKASDKIKDYYDEQKDVVKSKADTSTDRLKEDMSIILKDLGVATTRATEDYMSNIKNIEEGRTTDLDDLDHYVTTATERTGEDLETALANESRRFGLESDRINQSLADAGLTFSERAPEKVAQEGSAINTAGIARTASRSFADIARYEVTLNRDIEMKYGNATESAETAQKRTLDDLLNTKASEQLATKRGIDDIAFGKSVDIKGLEYGEDTDLATTNQMFAKQAAYEKSLKTLG